MTAEPSAGSARQYGPRVLRFLFAPSSGSASAQPLARELFFRGLGLVYVCAFGSWLVQAKGLVGNGGILPFAEELEGIRSALGGVSLLRVPTVFWLSASDGALLCVGVVGLLCGVALCLFVAPRIAAALAWALYLSVVSAGQIFYGYQWDNLLLEVGLLALFVAPGGLFPARTGAPPPPPLGMFLIRLLLFRLMFFSGVVKLGSGDPTWRNLTALDFHYWSQPIPSFTSPWVAALPLPFHKASVLMMFATELVFPWLAFGPARARRVFGWGTIGLQAMFFLTGNFGFFNLLSAVLALSLFDDRHLRSVLPARLVRRPELPPSTGRPALRWAYVALAAFLLVAGLAESLQRGGFPLLASKLGKPLDLIAPLRSVNGYGLFAVMTTERLEIDVQGSDDGVNWKSYLFPYKPGPLERRAPFAGFHMPRVDWQMWFAALGACQHNPWFLSFQQKLLEGKEPVLGLLESSPFPPEQPPKFVRSISRPYRFASPEDRARGRHWSAGAERPYCPTLTLVNGRLAAVR